MGFGGLSIATSGIRAAERNLNVTGHNISNAETLGYSRQRIFQVSAMTRTIGVNSAGNRMIQVMGTDWSEVHQIRNEFLDINYRNNVSPLSFYSTKVAAGITVETLLGELYGGYNFQTSLNDIWYSIQELTNHPEGIATRQFFLSNSYTFLTKAQEVHKGLVEYQLNLDGQIREMVTGRDGINATVSKIAELNKKIRTIEMSGERANDYRDERHLLLDHLATMIPIDVFESPDGAMNIMSLGHHILTGTYQSTMGLRYIANEIGFVEPVFTTSTEILSSGTPAHEFTPYINYLIPINAANRNDKGNLLGLIQARGTISANHISDQLPKPTPVNDIAGPPPINGLLTLAAAVQMVVTVPATIADLRTAAAAAPGNAILQEALEHAERDPNQLILRYVNAPVAERPEILAEMVRDFSAQSHNWQAHMWSLENAMIPQTQMNIDRVVNAVATMINDMLMGYMRGEDGNYVFYETDINGNPVTVPGVIDPITGEPQRIPVRPKDLNGDFGVPLFIRELDELNGPPYQWPLATPAENPGRYETIFTINNLRINPDFLVAGGHNLLALSLDGAPGNTDLLVALQKVWMSNTGHYSVQIGDDELRKFNVQDGYIRLVGEIATEIAEAKSKVSSQTIQVDQAQNMRMAIMGVSMDEEMNAMLRFQFAFQAASRVFNMIDQMIDRIVNGTGRVGM